MKKKLSSFDSEKDEWYYQPKIYINPKSADILYDESIEFRSSLSRDMSKKFLENLDSMLEEEDESEKGKSKRRKNNNSGLGKILNGNQKLRKPVISFFSDKAKVLKEEIEKINQDMAAREKIHKEAEACMQKDAKEVSRLLHDISLYSPGTSHSIDMRRMDLERELLLLNKELRIGKISLWKDIVFLRRELREIIFEYQALKRMAELVENGGGA
jgi:hypothetical protein